MHTAIAQPCRTGAVLALELAAATLAGAAAATEPPAPQDLPVCRLDPHDSSKLEVEPCRPAPPVQPRRAVEQVIGRMPAQRAVPPAVAMPPLPPSPAIPMPGLPQPVGSCDSGGCRDASGARYNGTGNATLDANGRICHRNGAFIQCF